MGALIEKWFEAWVLLPVLHAANNFADVAFELCWLSSIWPHVGCWLRSIAESLELIISCISLQGLDQLLVLISTSRNSSRVVTSWPTWSSATLLVRAMSSIKPCTHFWIYGGKSLILGHSSLVSFPSGFVNIKSWASKCKAILYIKIYATKTVMFVLHAQSYIFISELILYFFRRAGLVSDIWKARLSCIIVILSVVIFNVLELVLSKCNIQVMMSCGTLRHRVRSHSYLTRLESNLVKTKS